MARRKVSATVFFSVFLPCVAAPNTFMSLPPSIGVESEFWPPVFEYTCVSSISVFTFGRFCRITFDMFWYPMSPMPPSPPTTQTFGNSTISWSVISASVKCVKW